MGIIDEIYEALIDEEAMAALPGRLAAAVGARSSTFQIYEGQTPVFLASSYFSEDMNRYYMENDVSVLDPWTPLVTENGLFDQAVDSDMYLCRKQFENTAFYNEFFRRFGDDTGFSLGAVLKTRGGLVGLGLHHALRAQAYGDGAVDILNGALPHLRRLAEGRAILMSAEAQIRDAEALLHAQASPILLVDVTGQIRFANRAAEALLALGDGLISRSGQLRTVCRNDRMEAAIASAAGGSGLGDALLIERPSGEASYRLMITPHRGPGARPGRAMVLVEDPTIQCPDLAKSLRSMFGLSGAEADLAVRLFTGETLADASEARGVLVSTGRTQLNVILAKTGARRQSDLLRIIAGMPKSPRQ